MRRVPLVAAVLAAQFLGLVDGLIVSIGVPAMSADGVLDADDAHWVLNAYSVAFAGLLPLGGKSADLWGRRRVFLTGQALLLAGSLLGALATTPAMLLGARVVQAVGAGISTPAGIAQLADSFPHSRERSRVFGLLTMGGGAGWVSAGLLGGLLVAYLGWPSVFWVNVPICLLAITLALLAFPRRPAGTTSATMDWKGAVLLVAALALFVHTAGQVGRAGPLSLPTLAGATVAALLAVAFAVATRRAREPLLRLALLRRGGVPVAAVLGLALPVGFVSTQFLGSLYLQQVLDLSADHAGYVFLALASMPLLATPLASAKFQEFGFARSVGAGFALAAAGLGVIVAAVLAGPPLPLVIAGFVCVGVGVTMVYVPLTVASVAGIDEADNGSATSIFSTSHQIGGSIALAVLSSVALAAGGLHSARGLAAGFATAGGLLALAALGALLLLRRLDTTQEDQECQESTTTA
ncbi:MFS transporter [Streptosporangium sandarakinum]